MKRGRPLRRRTPLRQVSPRRASRGRSARSGTGPTLTVRLLVLQRDGWACVLCGGRDDLQLHHRKPRRMGGRADGSPINSPANLVTLCADDHAWAESRRAEALDMGLLLHEADDPEQVPVLTTRRGPIYLDDVGGWRSATGDGAQ
ncbi:HNH endonuclease [Thermomonospora cellulosilytica]|uniref:HNH nuclease domain-containing protein n=1 Tax=Thermomonospora cellulosilytica TaxID=1411118 RepID=A0A7W3MXK2_9ACTN|nr:HNH endonuclease signature motif containing protein [Thermomonospora cellulosilytica]MBA9003696.1 hypothetical protein [Thermomonospora cellulosilytica]